MNSKIKPPTILPKADEKIEFKVHTVENNLKRKAAALSPPSKKPRSTTRQVAPVTKRPTRAVAPVSKPAVSKPAASKPPPKAALKASKPSPTVAKPPAKKKRSAWDTSGRLQDLEQNHATTLSQLEASKKNRKCFS